ncbi:MAG TPA: formate dehydrogenase accessory sulfurtransferase FdhD, partial [Caulobacteraceae bacterium]|nr:formate dehydrogenase accessory sulfurtransferase FdhD [Caulobacteraceae bacterium]
MIPAARKADRTVWRSGEITRGGRDIPEETAVALTYNASTYAVMMASPADLEDFAVGFSLSEGVIDRAADIKALEIVETELGVDVQMWLDETLARTLTERRRRLAGPTGCGLCGVESLAEARRLRAPIVGDDFRISGADILAAMSALTPAQTLNAKTRATHGAGFWRPGEGLIAAREDVGRHNALDKLIGALARAGQTGAGGLVLLTSRVSVEMVQKTAVLGAPVLVAVSAPTALAVRTAEEAAIALVAIAREDGFEVFTGAGRVGLDAPA